MKKSFAVAVVALLTGISAAGAHDQGPSTAVQEYCKKFQEGSDHSKCLSARTYYERIVKAKLEKKEDLSKFNELLKQQPYKDSEEDDLVKKEILTQDEIDQIVDKLTTAAQLAAKDKAAEELLKNKKKA